MEIVSLSEFSPWKLVSKTSLLHLLALYCLPFVWQSEIYSALIGDYGRMGILEQYIWAELELTTHQAEDKSESDSQES